MSGSRTVSSGRGWSLVLGVVGAVLVLVGTLLLVRPQVVGARPFEVATPTSPAGPAVLVGDAEYRAGEVPAAVAVAPLSPVPPGRLEFPSVGVDAEVVPVGVLPSGDLQLPEDPARVGWWAGGALPGESRGTVVLAGHMDGLRRSGAMSALLSVEENDVVRVEDLRGRVHEYRVVARRLSPRQSLDPALFATDGSHRLVLITCGGTFDADAGRYTDNIVVVAEPVLTERRP
ncbi:sortase family protein [Georgenia soli]|uniref:Sortase family protein n=1 Tax=Georgenia soli TaxID=638953 RepID=A0A2A9EQ83_9MICO|nr:class F sortase [Georgenia soli]PFG41134.1 sortase family protein [Georgenia soli]